MTGLTLWLVGASALTAGLWLWTLAVGLWNRHAYRRRTRLLGRISEGLDGSAELSPGSAAALVLRRSSPRQVEHLVLERKLAPEVESLCCRYLLDRRGPGRYRRRAISHRGERSRWRRIEALRVLSLGGDAERFDLLDLAMRDTDPEIVGATVTLLAQVVDPRAADLLVRALRTGQYPDSRIATFLDAFPLDVLDRIWPLHTHAGARIRVWGTVLLGRYRGHEEVNAALVQLTSDPDAFVRKAALGSLARVGGPDAVRAAQARLTDRVGFVRSHAARALGALQASETAWQIAPLLGDREWWVRLAARQVLGSFGKETVWVVIPLLSHDDPFLRDGAEAVMSQLAPRAATSPIRTANWIAERLRDAMPGQTRDAALA